MATGIRKSKKPFTCINAPTLSSILLSESHFFQKSGVHKYRCTIGDDAFIGCNTNLVAPVNIGNEGYTAAGSTITEDVPDEAMGIARARQVNKPGYNRLLRRKKDAE